MKDRERITMVLGHLKMNANEFASSLGYKRTDRIYNVINGRNGISASLARDIHNKYESISYNWIAYGEGEMLSPQSTENSEQRINLLNTPIPLETGEESSTEANIERMANSFEDLMNKYEDMAAQRDYWRNKAQDLEYKLAKLEAV